MTQERPAPPRPRKNPPFTPELGATVIQALRSGNYLETAAAFAGVDASAVRLWVVQGLKGRTPELAQFARDCTQAQVGVEVRHVGVVGRAANGVFDEEGAQIVAPDWHAAAWFLERKFPQHWGRRDWMKITLDQANQLTDEDLEKELKRRGLA